MTSAVAVPATTGGIAILGWGSLLWDAKPIFDEQHGPWKDDGPSLRVEFSRISSTRLGALTLVIDGVHGELMPVAWCLSKRSEVATVVRDLRRREGCNTEDVKVVGRNASGLVRGEHEHTIALWAQQRGLSAVVWTGLPSNFEELQKKPFSVDEAISYLSNLPPDAKERAAEYITCAPEFVDTPLRKAVKSQPWFVALAAKAES